MDTLACGLTLAEVTRNRAGRQGQAGAAVLLRYPANTIIVVTGVVPIPENKVTLNRRSGLHAGPQQATYRPLATITETNYEARICGYSRP